MSTIRKFLRDESGATAIEYGVIAVGISVGIIVAVNGIGTQMKAMYTNVATQLGTAGQ